MPGVHFSLPVNLFKTLAYPILLLQKVISLCYTHLAEIALTLIHGVSVLHIQCVHAGLPTYKLLMMFSTIFQ